mgnify:FL=1
MNVTITPTLLKGVIAPPPSKSQAHRLLLAAALAGGESRISNVALSQDISATVSCLEELGASFRREGDALLVKGMGASAMSPLRRLALPRLDCGESGSTLRFLIPVALAVRAGGVFTGRGRLMERPQGPYFDLFDQKGIFYEQKDGVLTVSGALESGEYALPGNVSSQFFTGLLYALPLREGDSTLVSTTELESAGYLDMTLQAMERFGVTARREGNIFSIPGGQTYRPADCTVEADWSQAAFWYAAAGLGSDLDIRGLSPFSCQGDMRIAAFYTALRGEKLARGAGLPLPAGELDHSPLSLDMAPCPDLVPPVAALAALTEGRQVSLVHAARLRLKESDRLAAVHEVLSALGAEVEEGEDFLVIHGKASLPGGVTVDSHNDHRIAMMAAVAATRCEGPVTITGAECVAKSYPNFWDDYAALGGRLVRAGA